MHLLLLVIVQKNSKDLNVFLFTVPFPLLKNLTFLFHHASLRDDGETKT